MVKMKMIKIKDLKWEWCIFDAGFARNMCKIAMYVWRENKRYGVVRVRQNKLFSSQQILAHAKYLFYHEKKFKVFLEDF